MKKLMEKYGEKKVYGVAGGVLALIIAMIVGTCIMVSNQNKLVVNDKALVIELGEAVSLKPSTYLDKKVDKSIVNDTVLKSDLLTNDKKYTLDAEKQTVVTKDKEYLEVGKYDATLNYKKEELKITLEVKDKKAPSLEKSSALERKKNEDGSTALTTLEAQNIVLEQNSEDVDYTKFFEFKDFSEFKVTVNDKKVDLSKTGSYELEITAKDKYDNSRPQKVKVKVVSLEEAEKEGTITKTLDETVYQSKAMKDKIAEQQKVEEEKKAQEEQAQAIANNSSSNSGGGYSNGGGSASGGGSAPAQPNGIGAVINTAYSFVGRGDMSCNDLVVKAYSQNGYNVPYGDAQQLGYSVGTDSSVLQAGDLIIIPNHVMLVVSVSGGHITTIEGGRDGNNVLVTNHVVSGTSIWMDGYAQFSISQIRRY